ncbi:uncharacterized protein LOC132797710 [Drosophila nasuta]|uniref:uncharacterized protein LOC132797710 n=1 Tax=Drosophila nasuta TaxID=42062 RepID=UPI00295E2D09|nr:uncharacterized protein LOC132797710 [Drosophila nasuta]
MEDYLSILDKLRNAGSIIDLTFLSSSLAPRASWKVCRDFTYSDHQAIITDIRKRPEVAAVPRVTRYRENTLDIDMFEHMMQGLQLSGTATDMTKQIMSQLTRACNASMKKVGNGAKHQPVYWWTNEIAVARRECCQARRSLQRTLKRGNPDASSLLLELKTKRRTLKGLIKASKKRLFLELCDQAEQDPWGSAYKITMRKLNAFSSPSPKCPELLRKIVSHLFPQQPARNDNNEVAGLADWNSIQFDEVSDRGPSSSAQYKTW